MVKHCRSDFGIVYGTSINERVEAIKAELADLMVRYNTRTVRTYDLTWLMDLMTFARKIGLGQLSTWKVFRESPYIYGQNLEFFDDAMRYVFTGERDMSVITWMSIIDWDQKKLPMRAMERKRVVKSPFTATPHDPYHDVVELWCRRKDGPSDMLCTIYALFCGNPLTV